MKAVLRDKNILIGITGGIAAYKIPYLVRLLIKQGANVRVIMTERSKDFVSPLTLSVLSKNEVLSEISQQYSWNNHVELALWADVFLIAPLTANTLAKMAMGICDNLLLAVYFSAKCPVYFAPAMDLDMYKHPTVSVNIEKLISFGNYCISPDYGELASGLVGEGRMAEPERMQSCLEDFFSATEELKGKKVLVTAGPTYEAIDPVRFIGNHSTGKMGIAIANEAHRRGAEVILILGPSQQSNIRQGIKVHRVTSSLEMYQIAVSTFVGVDIAILSAAVADYMPAERIHEKIKKTDAQMTLSLVPTKDILATLGAMKKHQILIGFALETQNEMENAKSKIIRKNLDGIVLNSLRDEGAGFATDTNKITFIYASGESREFPKKPKTEVASDILLEVIKMLRI